MNLYVSIERDELLTFVVRAYRDHRLMAEATLPKGALAELFEAPLTSRECRIAIAANQQALANIIIRKASAGHQPVSSRTDREYRFVDLTLEDLLSSGERFSPGPLHVGPAHVGSARGRLRRAEPGGARPAPMRSLPPAAPALSEAVAAE